MRMPQELKDRIAESAKEHNRSLNADIVARLQTTFEEDLELERSPLGSFFRQYTSTLENAQSTIESQSKTILSQNETIKIQAQAIINQEKLILDLCAKLNL